MSDGPLLEVTDLVTRIPLEGGGAVAAVRGVSFSLRRGESMALVGESGSGKSMTVLSLMGLLPRPGRVTGGRAMFEGRDLLTLAADELRQIRGRRIGIVFQDPSTSLNPVLTVGQQLTEGLRAHTQMTRGQRLQRAAELLDLVGIPDAKALDRYPHEFSGGQRQRVLIAMAVSCGPSLLIADEPTTALDATIQAQIVELLKDLQKRLGMAILWITHDLALVAGLVDRVAVMYAGRIVEQAAVLDLFRKPRHPYTAGLLRAMPRPDARHAGGAPLIPIPGTPPNLSDELPGCAFAPRCPHVVDRCRAERPELGSSGPDHVAACFRSEDL